MSYKFPTVKITIPHFIRRRGVSLFILYHKHKPMSSKIDFATNITGITYPNTNAIQSTNYPLTAKKIGKMVFLAGSIQLTGYSSAAATLASDISNAAVLPQEVRPAMRQIFYAQSNGNVPIRVIVNTDGNIGLGRYKPYNDYTGFAQVAQNAVVNFTCAYVVE